MANIYWNESLIQKYDLQGPRYTSYPTAIELKPDFPETNVYAAAERSQQRNAPLSLYFHVPFCSRLCYYCGCNKVVTKKRDRVEAYLTSLCRELSFMADLYGRHREVTQIHFGGGTPTFLTVEEIRKVMEEAASQFKVLTGDQADIGIEIDPRAMEPDTLQHLREMGFNRVSLGVQDFEPRVQKAINRVQSEELTLGILEQARDLGFRSVNIDLIYGLPWQTPETFSRTIEKIIAFSPDRLSVFNYAHLPERFPPQRRITADSLPKPGEKMEILENTIGQLVTAGYQFIGMDHFAKVDDPLAIAQREGRLHRNFQGYTTHKECDLLALGVSSISMTDDATYQNSPDLDTYMAELGHGRLPIVKGLILSHDDRLRREVITALICQFQVDFASIEESFDICFRSYFARELRELESMVDDGLVDLSQQKLRVNPPGRLLIRVVCKVFDIYRGGASDQGRFSRII